MLTKTLGVIFLLCACLYLSAAAGSFERRRVRQSEGMLMLLRHIRTQISCFRTPIGDIYASFCSDELESCGFLPRLREGEDFCTALQECRQSLLLDEEETDLLAAFGKEVGGSYRDEQVEGCDYYIGELERICRNRREEQPKRVRLARSLVLAGGLLLILIFL